MIVQESDSLLQALDRRLEVDRVLALDPLKPVAGPADQRGTGAPSASGAGAATTSSAPSGQAALMARLPLGRIVPATIVDIVDADHVTAEVEQWRVALAWPSTGSAMPMLGQQIALRVLAHQPMLLFQNVDTAGDAIRSKDATADRPARWSPNALELARQDADAATRGIGVARFTEPIVQIRLMPATPTMIADRIALDDVIVGQATTAPGASSSSSQSTDDASRTMPPSLPIVLQGPAWPGQAMELVVRREQADETLENPALDPWCGDIAIDLPVLGRVSGRLSFSMHGLRIRLEGDAAETVASMHEASATLASALADADLRVHALSIGHATGSGGSMLDEESRAGLRRHG